MVPEMGEMTTLSPPELVSDVIDDGAMVMVDGLMVSLKLEILKSRQSVLQACAPQRLCDTLKP